jgi:hypothetical protein
MYNWNFHHLRGNEEFDPQILAELCEAFTDSMGGEGCTIEDIKGRLAECQLLGLLQDEQGAIYGCVMVSIPATPLNGKYLIWGNSGYLRKSVQRRMVWRQILNKITACFPDKEFGWIGCRTQNPLMMRSYSFFGTLMPFESDYSQGEGQQLMRYMRRHISQVRDVPALDATKGICQALYSTGRMGDYPVNLNGRIEQTLDEWGFQRDRGDSLVVVAELPPVAKEGALLLAS